MVDMYNGFEWYGRVLEVREVHVHSHSIPIPSPTIHADQQALTPSQQDRFAGLYGPSRGRGGPRGSFGGGRGSFGGGFRGRGGGRSTGNLYGDYTGPDSASSGNGYTGAPNGEVVPVQQILVTNVCPFPHAWREFLWVCADECLQLPWSTANEDLVELFETTGHVQQAEILYEGNRSKGMGIVQFEQIEEAETAIGASAPTPIPPASRLPLSIYPLLIIYMLQPSSRATCTAADP